MELFRRRDFAMIWFAGLFAYIGSGMYFVALPIWVYQQYGSATLVGTAALMAIIPQVTLGSVAGVFVDRWDRKRVMVLATIARVVLLLLLVLAAHSSLLSLVFGVRFGTSIAMQFFQPAEQSLIPSLVDGEAELVRANSLNQLNNNLGGIVGNALGGVLLLWVDMEGVALVMSALSIVGVALLSLIRYTDHKLPVSHEDEQLSFSLSRSVCKLASEWREGMRIFITNDAARVLLAIFLVASVTNVGFATLLPIFALESLNTNEAGVGLILMAMSIGGVLGAISLGFLTVQIPVHHLLQFSLLLSAILDIVFYGYPLFIGGVLLLSMGLKFLDGFPNAGLNSTGMTLFQSRVPDRLLGRALGAFSSMQAVVMLVATPVAAFLADAYSAQAVLLGITCTGLASWLLSLRMEDT